MRKDSKIFPIIFVNIAGEVYWGGINASGGGCSGIYMNGERLFELGDDERIVIIEVKREHDFISFILKEIL